VGPEPLLISIAEGMCLVDPVPTIGSDKGIIKKPQVKLQDISGRTAEAALAILAFLHYRFSVVALT
jgi:hypothetical protein